MSDTGTAPFEPWPDDVDVHLEWGRHGAALAAARGDLVVIIDVLSFSTSLTLTGDRDATALAYSAAEIEAAGGRDAMAAELDAAIVSKNRWATEGEFSLSPASLAGLQPDQRLIFTSLNGAACVAASAAAPLVLIGCLLNRTSIAEVVAAALADGRASRCTLIPCGEQWSSTAGGEGWRPGIEDHLGAGAIASRLRGLGRSLSPEASLAAVSFDAVDPEIEQVLAGCVSGRELITRGFGSDVSLAARLDTVPIVPGWETTNPVREFRPLSLR